MADNARVREGHEGGAQGPRIFISYRRQDSAGHAGRLFDALRQRFGGHTVFMDTSSIALGADYVRAGEDALLDCSVVLVLIGPAWLDVTDAAGRRRLESAGDIVRREIEFGLTHDLTIVPILVGGARMPLHDQLPPVLSALALHNALEISDARWGYDFERLADRIAPLLGATLEAHLDISTSRGKRCVQLQGWTLRIGRAPECECVIDDDARVSRHHAELWRDSLGWHLRDLGSTNHSFVNNAVAMPDQLLGDGDELRVGNTLMRFAIESDSDATMLDGEPVVRTALA